MALRGETVPVEQLQTEEIRRMFLLLDRHYANASWEGFREDLAEKTWVILLKDGDELAGFSTQLLMETRFEGELLSVVFSGDTIIDPAHWGSPELQTSFAALLDRLHRGRPDRRLFWFLISKGFRTYRILPIYFLDFHPRHDVPVPPWHRRLLDHLAQTKFPAAYRPERGILDFNGHSQYLRPPLSVIPEARIMANPHIRFFAEANPGWARGDELACLAEYAPHNLTPYLRRRLPSMRRNQPAALQEG
ncbi:MAG: hypothetical protein JF616_08065 [Fibrobacteres bacterium]|nr:hypothetical protein [Fibrobacterota bacterium]